jgi:hypothetical protein
MDNALWPTLAMAGVVGGVLVVAALYVATPAYRRRVVARFAKHVGLEADAEVADRLARRLTRRARAGLLGMTVGLGVSVGAALLTRPTLNDSTTISLVVAGSVWAGLGVGVALAALSQQLPTPGLEVRVARGREVAIGDFVAAGELVPSRVLTATVVGLVVLAWVATGGGAGTGILLPAGTVAAIGAVITQLVFEIASRAIVRQPVRAGEPTELAWDDAVRSSNLRLLLVAPGGLGGIGLVWTLFALLTVLPSTVGQIIANVSMYVILAGAALVLGLSLANRPQRHFLRRLWPELNAAALERERVAILAGRAPR